MSENTAELETIPEDALDTEMVIEDEADDGDMVVSIGDESPDPEEEDVQQNQPAPQWVKDLRKAHRELQRQHRDLQQKLTTAEPPRKQAVGPKPKLEDHDYDAEAFEAALESWYDRKRAADVEAEKAKRAEEEQAKSWQAKLDAYGKAKAALKVKDYEDAEAIAQETFSEVQQGIMLQGADNPALVVYALGKNTRRAKELAAIQDPVKFAFAVAKLEKELKVTTRKPPPAPEPVVKGTGRASSVDSTLERLRNEALKTGDMSKVMAYKRSRQQK